MTLTIAVANKIRNNVHYDMHECNTTLSRSVVA